MSSLLKVALTGGIATGKSYVLAQFARRGIPCLDADTLAHGVMAPGTEASRAIAARFGASMLDESGAVDRQKLAPVIFSDPGARRDLEAIVHPAVYRAIAAGLRGFELAGGSTLAVVDIPLLYETAHAGEFDKVIATACRPETQEARLVGRGLSREEARLRLEAQMTAEEKAARADHVIRTDGTFDDTNAQIEEVLEKLKARAGGAGEAGGATGGG
jgi:dephospho-CoA kinase